MITLNPTDSYSGVAATYFSTGSSWIIYTYQLRFSSPGAIGFCSTDKAGNIEPTQTIHF